MSVFDFYCDFIYSFSLKYLILYWVHFLYENKKFNLFLAILLLNFAFLGMFIIPDLHE